MLNSKNHPTVIFDNNGTLVDISQQMLSYGRDSYLLPMVSAEDYVYFGRYKPFKALHIEMAIANTDASTLAVEYWDGSAWAAVDGLLDDTLALNRSGFIQFEQPDDWELTTVNGQVKYFIRFKPADDFATSTAVQGMNIVFSEDYDLEGVYPGIGNYRASTEASFILRHENSRNLIVQELRNRGFRKKATFADRYQNIDAWDLLEHDEVRQWSIYLTLANIFSSLQSKEEGLYKQKTEEYLELAEMFKAAFYITLDKDDDGIIDPEESAFDVSVRRLVRR